MQTDRSIFWALSELSQRYRQPVPSHDDGSLTPYELCCFSQHGEDGVIAEVLQRIGMATRSFVEFGIESGREGNCVFLADVLGWSGVFIEPDEEAHAQLERKYSGTPRVTTCCAEVTPTNVEALFDRCNVVPEPDVLSIDVDGADYWIWRRITRFRPRLVVIEYNASLPTGRSLAQPSTAAGWQGTDYFGASLDALIDLGDQQEYRLVHTDLAGANAFFVRRDLAAEHFQPTADVPHRTEPNYFLTGYHRPADRSGRHYVDVSQSRLTDPALIGTVASAAPTPSDMPPSATSIEAVRSLVARTDFIWHQRFEIAAGVMTPGPNDVAFLMSRARMPETLNGETVLDIGTTNGGVAFELERRGAGRVIAVDILDPETFGFHSIREALGSRVEHLKASVYELPEILDGERFDLVVFLGVLYHLRHPLLALDSVRRLTRGSAYVESAICDGEAPHLAGEPATRFYRRDELGADPTNWFSPTLRTMVDWCASCGLEPNHIESWPEAAPTRGMISATPVAGPPEWQQISYELPVVGRIADPT